MKEEIQVTVYCLVYNHEKFLQDALTGFIEQETNFKYEIIVHDDASTDNSAAIIKKFELLYPDVIKPIYQEENQYQKGVKIFNTFIRPRIRGKYIAVCEGDDYWIDKKKLQLQYDYMESNSQCTLCFHNAKVVNMEGKFLSYFLGNKRSPYQHAQRLRQDMNLDLGNIIQLGFIPTASIFYPVQKYLEILDSYNMQAFNCGDLVMRLLLCCNGYAHYIDKVMSAYRIGNSQSASGSILRDEEKKKKTYNGHINVLNNIDIISDYKYHSIIKLQIERQLYEFYPSEVLKQHKVSDLQLSFSGKIRVLLHAFFPWLLQLRLKIKFRGIKGEK